MAGGSQIVGKVSVRPSMIKASDGRIGGVRVREWSNRTS
jgi:hypothetical protein